MEDLPRLCRSLQPREIQLAHAIFPDERIFKSLLNIPGARAINNKTQITRARARRSPLKVKKI